MTVSHSHTHISPQLSLLHSQPGLLVLKAEQSHAVSHEAEAVLLQHREVGTDEAVEHRVVGLMVRERDQEGADHLEGEGGSLQSALVQVSFRQAYRNILLPAFTAVSFPQ